MRVIGLHNGNWNIYTVNKYCRCFVSLFEIGLPGITVVVLQTLHICRSRPNRSGVVGTGCRRRRGVVGMDGCVGVPEKYSN